MMDKAPYSNVCIRESRCSHILAQPKVTELDVIIR